MGREERGGAGQSRSYKSTPMASSSGNRVCKPNREGCARARVGVAKHRATQESECTLEGRQVGQAQIQRVFCVSWGEGARPRMGWDGKEWGGSDGSSREVRAGAEAGGPGQRCKEEMKEGAACKGQGGKSREAQSSPNPRGVRGGGGDPGGSVGRNPPKIWGWREGDRAARPEGEGKGGGEAIKERSAPPG